MVPKMVARTEMMKVVLSPPPQQQVAVFGDDVALDTQHQAVPEAQFPGKHTLGLAHHHDLGIGVIGIGEVDELPALLGGGHARDDDVDLARLEGRDEGHELHVLEFDGAVQALRDEARQFPVMAGDAAILVDEAEGLARGGNTHAQRLARGGQRDVDFLIGARLRLEPALVHRLDGALCLEVLEDLADRLQELRIALAHGDRRILVAQPLIKDVEFRVLARHQQGRRVGGDDGIKLAGLERTEGVRDGVEALDLRVRILLGGERFTGGTRHHADAGLVCVRRLLDDKHVILLAASKA